MNREEYEQMLIEYETLYNRFDNLSTEEIHRFYDIENRIILYENLIYQKN